MVEKNKEILLAVIKQTKEYFENTREGVPPTTESIANDLELTRTAASRDLNQLFKQKQIIKINTRPVCFIAIEGEIKNELESEYQSLAQFTRSYDKRKNDLYLHRIVGWNRSLRKQVEQIKASLMYPDNGLPVIIFGQSGTGKSYFVRCAYDYAISCGVLKENAPFVTINCAQYADNPELLSSILFGYVKGAFTGAVVEKKGALAKANGGILFLDEVHRLSAEGQEKLFTFMDMGTFSPLGDDSRKINSSARLMFATTVNEETFLETFLRRVPIRVNMPSLEKRSFHEKRVLINTFLDAESERIKKIIKITNKALNVLYRHNYTANVGEAKNFIKSIIATAYANQLNNDAVQISIHDLPAAFYEDIENIEKNKMSYVAGTKTCFHGKQQYEAIESINTPVVIKIQQAWKYIAKMDESKIQVRSKYIYIVKNLMNHLYFSVVQSDDALFAHTIAEVRDVLKIMKYGEKFYENNNFVYGISVYVYYVLNIDSKNDINQIEVSKGLIQLFSKQYNFMQQIRVFLEREFEITFSKNDVLWLAIMMTSEELPVLPIPAIIMAHGYATASSISNTGNEILQYPVFHAIDMLPSASAEDMVSSLRQTLHHIKPINGVVIMIDMGSLSVIAKKVMQFFAYPMLLIDKVSTPIALEVGNKLQQGESLIEISHDIKKIKFGCTFLNTDSRRRNVIVSTCMTGVGTAEQIQKLLVKSFEGVIKVEVITCEFDKLQEGFLTNENNDYNVLGIIGVDNPHVPNVSYLGLEDIISGNKIKELKNILAPVSTPEAIQIAEQQLIKNFSLNRVMDSLTIISPEKVMPVLEKYLDTIKSELNKVLTNKKQIALYVHLGSMIERLIRGDGITEYKGNNELIKHDHIYSVLKKHISVIERPFLIKVNEPEMAYIREIIAI